MNILIVILSISLTIYPSKEVESAPKVVNILPHSVKKSPPKDIPIGLLVMFNANKDIILSDKIAKDIWGEDGLSRIKSNGFSQEDIRGFIGYSLKYTGAIRTRNKPRKRKRK